IAIALAKSKKLKKRKARLFRAYRQTWNDVSKAMIGLIISLILALIINEGVSKALLGLIFSEQRALTVFDLLLITKERREVQRKYQVQSIKYRAKSKMPYDTYPLLLMPYTFQEVQGQDFLRLQLVS